MRTVVADTSALVSLAVSRADAPVDTDVSDLLQYLLTSCGVFAPPEVVAELCDITQYQDIHAAAATNVLAARNHYTVEDPYNRDDTPGSRPTFGLDDGETDGIVLANANARSVDTFRLVIFGGDIDYWIEGGNIDLKPWEVIVVGDGDQAAAVERLRSELEERGWFEDGQKQRPSASVRPPTTNTPGSAPPAKSGCP